MLSLTRKTDYALLALATLAEAAPVHRSSSQNRQIDQQPVSVRRIAQNYALPVPQLMNVLKDLQRAGLVKSTRGIHGGYTLARQPQDIKLIRVIEAIEGPLRLTMCCGDDPGDQDGEAAAEPSGTEGACEPCSVMNRCPVTVGTRKLNEIIITILNRITVRDLMESDIDVPIEILSGVTEQMRSPAPSRT